MRKIRTFYPDKCCSGTGVAVKEFVNYMEELETAHQAKVRMIKPINVFGYIKIKYEVLEKEVK